MSHELVVKAPPEDAGKAPGARVTPSALVQRKAVVGRADDPAELEADRVADLVVRALASAPPVAVPSGDRVQRGSSGDLPQHDADADTPRIRRSATSVGAEGGTVDADTDRRIRAGAGGTRMEPRLRRSMETAFGADFSDVRVHSGSESRQLNDRIQASAFTSGNHVWFRDGVPDTDSASGQRLVAHELTHVVQQNRSVRRSSVTIRRKGGDKTATKPADLASMNLERDRINTEIAALKLQITAQEAKVESSKLLAKMSAKGALKKLKAKLAKLETELSVLGGEIKPLQDAEDDRIEKERVATQAKVDSETKDYTTVANMALGALVEYTTNTANWHEHSSVSPAQRNLVNEVLSFASVPTNQAPCAAFTVSSLAAAMASNGGTMTSLLDVLSYYVDAAGEARDPFPVGARTSPADAAWYGEGLKRLLAGFPRWVLAGSMKEQQLYDLKHHGLIDDVITYSQFGPSPPTFQAANGSDFTSYLAMRVNDNVDPASFQGGPLSAYIRNFHRFPAPALKGLQKNFADTTKKRPLTLILHSAIDHNGAFHRDPNMTAVVTHPKNLTLMIEGGTTLSAYQSLIGPLARSHGNNDKIDQVMFAGHGGSRIIELAGGIQENTVDVDEHGTIAQIDRPIDLDGDPAGAQAFFDEILDNMDKSVVDKLAPKGPAQQANRRILFNACLTNSNEVGIALTENRAKARKEIRDYITNNASLATYMATYAKSKGADVTSLGANASITQVELIDAPTGKLDLVAPQDPKVTASKLVYLEQGNEPHGVLLAALEAWANQPAEALKAMRRRAAKKSGDWDQAVIEGTFELALKFSKEDSFASDMQTLAGHAHVLSEMRLEDHCRVSRLSSVMNYWKADPAWGKALTSRLAATSLFRANQFTALVLSQMYATTGIFSGVDAHLVSTVLPNFNAQTARDYVDVKYLDTGVMATIMGKAPTKGSVTLALIGVLDPAKPASCIEHLRKASHPGAPLIPKLPAVDPVPPVPAGVGPRAEIPAVPEVPGRPKVDEIPGKRPESPEVAALPELPKMPEVAGPPPPAKQVKGKTAPKPAAAPAAPKRDGRIGRPEAPEIPAVKPFFDATHDIETLLAGRATTEAIAALVNP